MLLISKAKDAPKVDNNWFFKTVAEGCLKAVVVFSEISFLLPEALNGLEMLVAFKV